MEIQLLDNIKYERTVSEFLKGCMIKETHRGYRYLEYALNITRCDSTATFNIKKNIYIPIELYFDVGDETVERCIKYAIKEGFRLSKEYKRYNLFKDFKTVPSNKVFIELASRELKNM